MAFMKLQIDSNFTKQMHTSLWVDTNWIKGSNITYRNKVKRKLALQEFCHLYKSSQKLWSNGMGMGYNRRRGDITILIQHIHTNLSCIPCTLITRKLQKHNTKYSNIIFWGLDCNSWLYQVLQSSQNESAPFKSNPGQVIPNQCYEDQKPSLSPCQGAELWWPPSYYCPWVYLHAPLLQPTIHKKN